MANSLPWDISRKYGKRGNRQDNELAEGRAAGIAVGRSEGIQIGAEREQKLTKFLLRDNRIDDLKRALDDPAFRQKLLGEYGIE